MNAALRLLVVLLSVASVAHSQTYTEWPWTYTTDFSNPAAGTARITGYSGSVNMLVIPSVLGGAAVVTFDGTTNVFVRKSSITSVTIPDSMMTIPHSAFSGCTNITNVTFGSGLVSIGQGAFGNCTSLTTVAIPHGVSSIGDSAFGNCTGLTNVTIPDSVISIGYSAFQLCSRLQSVTIPRSVMSIGDSTFRDCHALTNVTIPDSVTSIGNLAFYQCISLQGVTIPRSVTSIGNNAFQGCTSLSSIEADPANAQYVSRDGVLYNKPPTTIVEAPLGLIGSVTIPDGVTNLGSAFRGRARLTSVTIGGGVTSINDGAFQYCQRLTRVTVAASVTSISATAFQGAALNSVYFQGSMPSVGGAIFAGITPAGTVYYPRGNTTWGATYAGWPTQPYDLPTPQAVLEVEHPSGAKLSSGANADPFPASPIGVSPSNRVYTLLNTGGAFLSNIVVAESGPNSSDFSLTPPASNALAAGATTTFSVAFLPTSSGTRTAQVSITSNDTNNSPFVINLSGFGLGEDLDTDGDGLNDAAEFTMAALGFDWQTYQPTLVATLYSNANRANLFTQLQYESNRITGVAEGKAEVIEAPESYGLYDSTSIMDLRMGGLMIQKQGADATIVFQPQTTTDLVTLPFTNNGPPITNAIPMPGDKGFLRVEAIYVPAGDLINSPPSGY